MKIKPIQISSQIADKRKDQKYQETAKLFREKLRPMIDETRAKVFADMARERVGK